MIIKKIYGKLFDFHNNLSSLVLLGFTLVEMMVVLAIIGSLAGIATPVFLDYKNKINSDKATEDIKALEAGIVKYFDENGRYPSSLTLTRMANMRDPWGNPYQYLWIQGNPDPGVNAKVRKNMFNIPVNTDFDLYSMGPDGRTHASFTMVLSRDDIVRAYDGSYYGSVSDL